jgi:hypothetical protein
MSKPQYFEGRISTWVFCSNNSDYYIKHERSIAWRTTANLCSQEYTAKDNDANTARAETGPSVRKKDIVGRQQSCGYQRDNAAAFGDSDDATGLLRRRKRLPVNGDSATVEPKVFTIVSVDRMCNDCCDGLSSSLSSFTITIRHLVVYSDSLLR